MHKYIQFIDNYYSIDKKMEQIASKTFASQFVSMSESRVMTSFERMTIAVKNNRIQLLHTIPQDDKQIHQKDEFDKNLLFYAMYEKQPSAALYLLCRGVSFTDYDNQKKNIYHLGCYAGSYQCLEAINTYSKIQKISKLNQLFLINIKKHNFKRTDAKNGKLKYQVSPKRQEIFKQLQNQMTKLYAEYLDNYLNEVLGMLKACQDIENRNPLHLVCLNKYQKCFATLQTVFRQLQNPDLVLTEHTVSQYDAISKILQQKIDPRLYVDVLSLIQDIILPSQLNKIHESYQNRVKDGIREILTARDKDQQTPLCIASKNGSTAMINFLKKHKPNTKDEQKKQIIKVAYHNLARSHILDLCEASKLPDTKPLNFLISCGEEVNQKKTIFGTFALLEAVKSFKTERSLEPIKILVKNGANVNAQDTNGWTVFHHAAYLGEKQIIQLLFNEKSKNNFDPNKLTNKRYHSLHLAAMANHPEIIKYLIGEQNLKIDVCDGDGCTALHHAAKKGSFQSLKELIELGASIYALDLLKMTPLHHAAASNSIKCIKELLKCDGDQDKLQDMRNSKGKKPKDLSSNTKYFDNIYRAAKTGNVNIIRKLVAEHSQLKDEPTVQKNRTPIIIAVIAQSLTSVKFLLQLGVDTYHEDKDGKSVNDYAEEALKSAQSEKNKEKISIAEQIKSCLESYS